MRISPFAATTALAIGLLLAGCAPELESKVYVSDILDVAGGAGPITTPATFRVPQSGSDSCKTGLERLIENLATLAPTTGKGRCIEQDGDNLAEIETSMVIAAPGADIPEPNLFVLEVTPDPDGATVRIRLLQSIEAITKVLAANSDELQVDFDPARFIFTIDNDSDDSVQLTANNVFVDNQPGLPELGPQAIGHGDSVEIRLSDVASVYVERANAYAFARITGN